MYLFGSHLIKKYFPEFREPNDIDYVTNDKSKLKTSKKGEEYYYIPDSPSREMTVDEIYTLKVSHAIYDIHWKKTMSDIRFLQNKNAKIDIPYLEKLRKHWDKTHKKKRVNFDVDSSDFFNDKVKREIEHDDLHIMLNSSPTYLKIVDGIIPNEDKFFNLTKQEQVDVLFEESFVISIERFSKIGDKSAYNMAQQALVTRLHPIWMADFIILNWNTNFWTAGLSRFYEKYTIIKNKLK